VADDTASVAAFAYELGLLKRIRRSGCWHVGVRDPESVAEHTMRTAQLAAIIAADLEMLLQAVEYRELGVHRVDGWIEAARKSLTTDTGRRIAEAAITLSPLAWRDR
jgi:putative hydrolases of HD superfamily